MCCIARSKLVAIIRGTKQKRNPISCPNMAPSAASATDLRTAMTLPKGQRPQKTIPLEESCDIEHWLTTPENICISSRDVVPVSQAVETIEPCAFESSDLLESLSIMKEDDSVVFDVPGLAQCAEGLDAAAHLFSSLEHLMDVNNESMAFHDEEGGIDEASLEHITCNGNDSQNSKSNANDGDDIFARDNHKFDLADCLSGQDAKMSYASSAGDTTPAVSPMSTPSPPPTFRDSFEKRDDSSKLIPANVPCRQNLNAASLCMPGPSRNSGMEVDLMMSLNSCDSADNWHDSRVNKAGIHVMVRNVSSTKQAIEQNSFDDSGVGQDLENEQKRRSARTANSNSMRKRRRDAGNVPKNGNSVNSSSGKVNASSTTSNTASRRRNMDQLQRGKSGGHGRRAASATGDGSSGTGNWMNNATMDDKNVPVRDRCIRCNTPAASTPMMRKGPDGCRSMCNACGLRWARHGIC